MPNVKLLPTTRTQRRRQRGAAIVEFAFVLVPMLVLAFGVTEYGRAVYQYNTLVKSTRSAVRLLAQADPSLSTYDNQLMPQARCMAVHGNVDCEGPVLAPGLATANVRVCDRLHGTGCGGDDFSAVATGEGAIDLVAVRIVNYEFSFLGLPFVTTGDALTFGPIEAVMRQGT